MAVVSITATIVLVLLNLPDPDIAREANVAPSDSQFQFAAEKFILQRLKAPGTAQFAPSGEWVINRINEQHAELISWVDAQNGFGALLRNHFVAEVHFDGSDNYELSYLAFDESEDKFGKPHTESLSVAWDNAQEQIKAAAAEKKNKRQLAKANARAEENAAASRRMREQGERAQEQERERRRQAEAVRVQRMEEARKIALEKQKEINEAYNRLMAEEKAKEDAKYRKWKSATGKHATEAKIVSFAAGVVTLQKRSGERTKVQLDRLSEEDRQFVESWRRDRR